MGSIEFLGIINSNFSLGQVNLPNNANVMQGIDNTDSLYMFLFCLPILICILIPTILKHKKNGLLNKECMNEIKKENIEKYGLDTKGKKN